MSLELPWPPSVNRYWRSNRGRVHISAEGRKYRETVVYIVSALKHTFGTGRLSVSIEACVPDRRRRDLDNLTKAVLDSMQHGGLYADDSQIDELYICRGDMIKGGMLIIDIVELKQHE